MKLELFNRSISEIKRLILCRQINIRSPRAIKRIHSMFQVSENNYKILIRALNKLFQRPQLKMWECRTFKCTQLKSMQIANSILQSWAWKGHKSTSKPCVPVSVFHQLNWTTLQFNVQTVKIKFSVEICLWIIEGVFFQSNFTKTVSTRINVDVTWCIIYNFDWGSWCKSSWKFNERNENTLRVRIAFSMSWINIKKNIFFRVDSFLPDLDELSMIPMHLPQKS